MTQYSPQPEDTQDIPSLSDDSSLGDIKINHSVVASIVRIAAEKVEGVYGVGSSLVDGIADIFKGRESDRGVRVNVDEAGHYLIEIRIVMLFGVELAKVAYEVQQCVQKSVRRMTSKNVSRIDVIIDGIKLPDSAEPAEDDEEKAWTPPQYS